MDDPRVVVWGHARASRKVGAHVHSDPRCDHQAVTGVVDDLIAYRD